MKLSITVFVGLTEPTPMLVKIPKPLAEKQMQQKRMHDVNLLLTHLFENEKAAVKLILDSLYDVGAVNIINKKLQSRSLNSIAKSVARMSKPAFRIFALRWVQKNCPQLITDWLHSQVAFTNLENQQAVPVAVPVAISEVQLNSLSGTESTSPEEIKRLRSEVRYLAGISIGALAALVSTIVSINPSPQAITIYPDTNSLSNMYLPTEVKSFDARTVVSD